MTGITATEARSNLYRLIDETAESHQPIVIMGKRNKAVLVSEEDWSAIQETLYLLSVPGMRESIREGMDTPVEEWSYSQIWWMAVRRQSCLTDRLPALHPETGRCSRPVPAC